jgi:hypothetical protein
MTCVVISQPMFFPWVGLFEQIRLADVYVHYDDVQFSKGSFTNRVQIKTARGSKWLTLPVRIHLGQSIREVELAAEEDWRKSHLSFLAQSFEGAPYAREALDLVERVYGRGQERLCDVVIASMEVVLEYFDLAPRTRFLRSSEMGIPGKSWERVLDVVRQVQGDRYVTGQGALDYLDHEAFERAGVAVEYLNYEKRPYPQLHGEFTPFVSILDLIANAGRDGRRVISSGTKPWRDVVRG